MFGRAVATPGVSRYRRIVALVAGLLSLLIAPAGVEAAAPGQFQLESQSASYNAVTGKVTFDAVFNRDPDFLTTDPLGRQADSFQYFVVGDPSLPYPSDYDSIIRGEEIHSTKSVIPIRNAAPPDLADPLASGWGTLRGEVPYSLRGPDLTFSAPLGLITDRVGEQTIDYTLQVYGFGGLSSSVDGHVVLLNSREQCRNGGWQQFGFRSEGQCTVFVVLSKLCEALKRHGIKLRICPPSPARRS